MFPSTKYKSKPGIAWTLPLLGSFSSSNILHPYYLNYPVSSPLLHSLWPRNPTLLMLCLFSCPLCTQKGASLRDIGSLLFPPPPFSSTFCPWKTTCNGPKILSPLYLLLLVYSGSRSQCTPSLIIRTTFSKLGLLICHEDGGNTLLWNNCEDLSHYMLSYPRRQ